MGLPLFSGGALFFVQGMGEGQPLWVVNNFLLCIGLRLS